MELSEYLKKNPPVLLFNGFIGACSKYPTFPRVEVHKILNSVPHQVVFERSFQKTNSLFIEDYCIIKTCLDVSGQIVPEKLLLPQEMEGHEISVVLYLDPLQCLHMIAVGGYTTLKTRNTLNLSLKSSS